MKNLILILFISLTSMAIIGCSKGNPKNTDLIGDKNKQLIVGKWLQVADTTIVTYNGVVQSRSQTGITTDFFQYNADGTATQFSGTSVVGSLTYTVVKDILTLNSPAVNSGGVSISAFSYPVLIRKLDAKDLVLYNHAEQDTVGTGLKTKVITDQISYYKKQ